LPYPRHADIITAIGLKKERKKESRERKNKEGKKKEQRIGPTQDPLPTGFFIERVVTEKNPLSIIERQTRKRSLLCIVKVSKKCPLLL
jgi:hypothetical protein